MHVLCTISVAELAIVEIARLRLVGMLVVLIGGLTGGYLARSKFGLPEDWARRLMTLVIVCFSPVVALFVVWRVHLQSELIWLPVAAVLLTLAVLALSAGIFSLFEIDHKSRLTLILAAGLSNLGYTGAAFVCYALFGSEGLALAHIYIVLWLPLLYFVFFPLLKIHELASKQSLIRFRFYQLLDYRMLITPAVIAAMVLNLSGIPVPALVSRSHIIDILVYLGALVSFFAIGLRVDLPRLRGYIGLSFLVSAVKFVLTPAVAVLTIWLLKWMGYELTALVRNVIIVAAISPSAVVMVTMSNVFDLNAPLASALWVVTTAIFACLVVPILFFIFA